MPRASQASTRSALSSGRVSGQNPAAVRSLEDRDPQTDAFGPLGHDGHLREEGAPRHRRDDILAVWQLRVRTLVPERLEDGLPEVDEVDDDIGDAQASRPRSRWPR